MRIRSGGTSPTGGYIVQVPPLGPGSYRLLGSLAYPNPKTASERLIANVDSRFIIPPEAVKTPVIEINTQRRPDHDPHLTLTGIPSLQLPPVRSTPPP